MHVDPDEPIIYLELRPGTPVVASDGVEVGTVKRVMHHERERLLDGLVVQSDDGRRFVDAPEVGTLTHRRVTLEIDSASFLALAAVTGVRGLLRRRWS